MWIGDEGAQWLKIGTKIKVLAIYRPKKRELEREGKRFEVTNDNFVVTVGCYPQTFGTKGVKENPSCMKDVGDARRVTYTRL